jgi:ubiquinone/menaquinone biosynthesis C-methylase UbiE
MRRLLIAALLVLACHAPAPAPVVTTTTTTRTPAPVMSAEGAPWLERAERDVEERPDLVLAAMQLKDGDVVADVGAGSGYFTRRLARAVAPRGIVYANDIQPEMLAMLQERTELEGLKNIVTVLGTETDPKLPANTFDWILLVDVYHEFQQPQPMLAAMRAALKPGGRVALVEYRENATHIREEHRMSVEEVTREWTAGGFTLLRIDESLPVQRLFLFQRR